MKLLQGETIYLFSVEKYKKGKENGRNTATEIKRK